MTKPWKEVRDGKRSAKTSGTGQAAMIRKL
jgi:hypothetical protein